jgi:membrane protease YdiL (CAAX protease family)
MGSVAKFFLLTFVVTWTCYGTALEIARRSTSSSLSFEVHALVLIGTFAPSLVALALTALYGGRSDVGALIARIFQFHVKARWYLFAVSYMVVIKLAAALAHRALLGAWPRFGQESPAIIIAAIIFSTPFQSGEEIGWRGYALPRMAESMGFRAASLLLGVVWALWHLPLFFLPGADTYLQSFPVWGLEVVALSVAITWLYTHVEGSLLLTMLMHSAINQTIGIVPSASSHPTNAFSLHVSSVMWLTAALVWIAATYFLVRMPKAEQLYSGAQRDSHSLAQAG